VEIFMPGTFIRNRFTWLAYLMLALYAYFLNILGPITPFLKEELNLSYTISSLHFTAFAVGLLAAGLGGHLVIGRLGRWRSLWLGAVGMCLSALLLIAGHAPWLTIGASFLMGLIGSLILVIVSSALSDQHGLFRAVALSEANSIASLISTAAPLMVGWFAQTQPGWRMSLAVAASAPLLLGLGFGKAYPPAAAPPQPEPRAADQPERQALPTRFWVCWFAILLSVAVEFCMIFWSADYLENSLGMLKADAAQAVSLFLGGMILGRLAGSRLVQRFSTHAVLTAAIMTAGSGFLIFWLTRSLLPGLIGLFICGLGVASLYPLTLSLAIGSAGSNTVQASARATLASGTAILTLPLVLGRLADALGIRPAYGVILVLLVGVMLIVQLQKRGDCAVTPEMI
jgi:fucose permease